MATYRGKKVTLNKVQRGGSKKSFVYVKAGNKVKKVSFGSKTMRIRKQLLDLRQKHGTGAVKLGVNLTINHLCEDQGVSQIYR